MSVVTNTNQSPSLALEEIFTHQMLPCAYSPVLGLMPADDRKPSVQQRGGSMHPSIPADDLRCANCDQKAGAACQACRLVVYCNKDCQTAHWIEHNIICKSPMMKASWQPEWWKENRKPTFYDEDRSVPSSGDGGRSKYYFGNVPAIDIVQLEANEGATYDRELNILFAGMC